MKQQTRDLIASLLQSDETVTPEKRDYILRAMRQATPIRRVISAKGAMKVLGISRPTLREYAKRGVLEQINISTRKVRFDEEEVNRLAYKGIKK